MVSSSHNLAKGGQVVSGVMTSINFITPFLIAAILILIAGFPAMIENLRKASRETHMHAFGTFAGEKKKTQLADFIEGSYSDNRVVFLKMMKGVMLAAVFAAIVFFVFAFHISANVMPQILNTAKGLGLPDKALEAIAVSINQVPFWCHTLTCILVGLVLLTSLIIGFIYELPRIVKNALNP